MPLLPVVLLPSLPLGAMDNRREWPIVVVGSLTLNEIPVHLVPLSLGITILPGPHPLLPNLFGWRHIIPVSCLVS